MCVATTAPRWHFVKSSMICRWKTGINMQLRHGSALIVFRARTSARDAPQTRGANIVVPSTTPYYTLPPCRIRKNANKVPRRTWVIIGSPKFEKKPPIYWSAYNLRRNGRMNGVTLMVLQCIQWSKFCCACQQINNSIHIFCFVNL